MSEKIMQENNEEETYAMTPWGCLYGTLLEYGINLSHITGRVGKHIVDNFMESLVNAGYVSKSNDDATSESILMEVPYGYKCSACQSEFKDDLIYALGWKQPVFCPMCGSVFINRRENACNG